MVARLPKPVGPSAPSRCQRANLALALVVQVAQHLHDRELEIEVAESCKAKAREARRQHLGREAESAPPSAAAKKKPLFMEDVMDLERRQRAGRPAREGGARLEKDAGNKKETLSRSVLPQGGQASMQAQLAQRARAEDEAMARRVEDLRRTAASERLALASAIQDVAAFVEASTAHTLLDDDEAPLPDAHTAVCGRFDEHFAHELQRVRAQAADDRENLSARDEANNARLAGQIWSELFSEGASEVEAKTACAVVPLYLRSCNRHLPHLLEQGFRVATAQAVRRSRACSSSGVAEGERRAGALLQDWRALSPFVVRGASSLLRQRARVDREQMDQTFLQVLVCLCLLLSVRPDDSCCRVVAQRREFEFGLLSFGLKSQLMKVRGAQALEVAEDAAITREMWETRLFSALPTAVGVAALLPTLRCVLGLASVAHIPIPLCSSAREKSCAPRGESAVERLAELFTPRTRRVFFAAGRGPADLGQSPPR